MAKQIKKYGKSALILGLILVIVAMYGLIPTARAGTLSDRSDTLSTSELGATDVVHLLDFEVETAVADTGSVVVIFGATIVVDSTETEITLSDTGLKDGATALPVGTDVDYVDGQTIVMDLTGALTASTQYGIRITAGIDNSSSEESQSVTMKTNSADSASGTQVPSTSTDVDTGAVMVAFISGVTVTATVSETLTFDITGIVSGTVNGATINIDTSADATKIPFDTLPTTGTKIAAQNLTVITNATSGFTVTLEQDNNLQTAGAVADIDCFKDNATCVSTPETWASPTGTLGTEGTYGHFGFTSEDTTLSGGDTFGDDKWAGLSGTTPFEVFYHDGPADGSTDHQGATKAGFQVEITALQEAGAYTNTLTYICTPIY